jgi:hypothetical protein
VSAEQVSASRKLARGGCQMLSLAECHRVRLVGGHLDRAAAEEARGGPQRRACIDCRALPCIQVVPA